MKKTKKTKKARGSVKRQLPQPRTLSVANNAVHSFLGSVITAADLRAIFNIPIGAEITVGVVNDNGKLYGATDVTHLEISWRH